VAADRVGGGRSRVCHGWRTGERCRPDHGAVGRSPASERLRCGSAAAV